MTALDIPPIDDDEDEEEEDDDEPTSQDGPMTAERAEALIPKDVA